ncbi:hypothetical protein ACWEQL_42245, partial [Kitasatospora sp. NPDC004240]
GLLAVTVPRWLPEKICWALSDEYHEVEGGHDREPPAGEPPSGRSSGREPPAAGPATGAVAGPVAGSTARPRRTN